MWSAAGVNRISSLPARPSAHSGRVQPLGVPVPNLEHRASERRCRVVGGVPQWNGRRLSALQTRCRRTTPSTRAVPARQTAMGCPDLRPRACKSWQATRPRASLGSSCGDRDASWGPEKGPETKQDASQNTILRLSCLRRSELQILIEVNLRSCSPEKESHPLPIMMFLFRNHHQLMGKEGEEREGRQGDGKQFH